MSTPSAQAQSMKDKKDAVLRTAQISWTIREQIRAALPTPEEQFLTVMVPGKVINFKDYIPEQDKGTNDDLKVQLNEAMLVDDMPATSGVQLGPTGRSIAESYATALDLLITTGTIVGIDPPKDPKNTQDPQTRYQNAMKWLGDGGSNGKSKLDFYKTYQSAYTKAFELMTRADGPGSNEALEKSRKLYPDSPSSQDKHYREW
ncbi:hypothetical protein CPB86DRAFT_800483 [Serendipita vermifera]|nr:hypothetical protein CPB86DRAFT_800483 [Serendipita vermifera]